MAIIKRGPKARLQSRWRSKAFGLVSRILGENPSTFNYYLTNANREYVILNNRKKFRGFAVVKNFPNKVQLELIGTNTRPGQKGWGRHLMNAIRKNAGRRNVVIHDPVSGARGFYKHVGYNTASNTTGGTSTMRRKASPNIMSKRKLSPIRESPSPKRAKSSPRRSPRSPQSASARRSP